MIELTQAHVAGVSLIVVVSVIWIAASFLVQSIEKDLHPFLLTFFCNGLFLVYLPLAAVQDHRKCVTICVARSWDLLTPRAALQGTSCVAEQLDSTAPLCAI